MTENLTEIEKRVINNLQGGFPVCARPFLQAASDLDMTEDALMQTIEDLLERNIISRFGPLFDIEKTGGAFCLCAISTAENDWQQTADILNSLAEVAHNYLRSHHYNLWFVLATETEQLMQQTISKIETLTGYSVLALPKEKEFFIGLHLEV